MRIEDYNKFGFGLVLIILSYIPFSYMDHAEKFKIENCDKISGTLTEISRTYDKSGKRQNGCIIKMKEFDFKIRVIGEYYNAINQNNFARLMKPDTFIDIYILKTKYYGIFENLNDNMGIKDAVTIICSDTEILDLKSIRDRLSHLFAMNLIFGIIAIGFGVKNIYKSIITTANNVHTK